jgi:hypothetical protein
MRGLPIRCTWRHPPAEVEAKGDRRTVILGRDVFPETPIVAAGELADSILPVLVRSSMGTSMAEALTPNPDTVPLAKFLPCR